MYSSSFTFVGLVVSAALAVGCGSTGQSAAELNFSEGSRLGAWSLFYPGTESLLLGVYDREKGVHCQFKTAPDGKLRCLPESLGSQPSEAWVEGESTLLERPSRITPVEIHSADGGRFRVAAVTGLQLVDRNFSAPCSLERGTDGTARCLPGAAYYLEQGLGWFEDAACEKPLAYAPLSNPQLPIHLIIKAPERKPFSIGEEKTSGVFSQRFGSCVLNTEPLKVRVFALGTALPDDTISTLRIVPQGTDRLALRVVEDDSGALATETLHGNPTPAVYVDRTLGIDCMPLRTPDGTIRCLGDVQLAEPTLHFADDACTKPVVYHNGEKQSYVALTKSPPNRPVTEVTALHRAGESIMTTYAVKDGRCEKHEQHKIAYRVLEETVAWEQFALLQERL